MEALKSGIRCLYSTTVYINCSSSKSSMLDELNDQIHLQIKTLLNKNAHSPFDYNASLS